MNREPLEQPLTQAELEEFEQILDAAGRMPLEILQGYFCGVVCTPVALGVSDWLPTTLIDERPPLEASEHDRLVDLLMRFYNQQIRALDGEEEPLLCIGRDEVTGENDNEPWCSGFLDGTGLAADAWSALADPGELDELLYPFRFLAGEFDKELRPRFSRAEWKKEKREFGEDLWPAVLDVYRYAGALRNRPTTVRREGPKVGRNDPCVCGSGKKFKNCCGKA